MNQLPHTFEVPSLDGNAMLPTMRRSRSRFGNLPPAISNFRSLSRRRAACTVERLEERLALTATITLSTYQLAPNTPNQTIDITVSGGDAVQGVDLAVTTGDGGPMLSGSIAAPAITAVNLLPVGGVFTNDNTGQQGGGQAAGGQFFSANTTTANGTVFLAGQLLATITIDTTGFFTGSYSISVGGTINNGTNIVTEATDFPPETSSQVTRNPNFTDGVLVVSTAMASAVSLNASANPSAADAAVTFTAIVSGSGAAPTGTVTFFDGPTPLGSPVSLSAATAMLQTSALPVGSNSITAQYHGDSTYAPSTSMALGEGVTGLAPTLAGTLPASVIATTPAKFHEKLTLTATGIPVAGKFSSNILLSPDESAADSVLTLASTHGRVKLKAGKAANFNLRFPRSIPASVTAGSYHLLIQFTDTAGVVSTIDSGKSLTVVAPTVDLTGSFVKVPATVKAGRKFAATFLVTNLSDANVSAVGLLPIEIATSADAQFSDAVAFETVKRHINLKPGKSVKITLTLSASASTDLFVDLDPAHAVFANDTALTNNVFSQQVVTV